MKSFACAMLLAFAVSSATAQSLQDQPGYVDFGDLAEIDSEPAVEVSLGSALLGFLSAAAEEEDPELASALSRLRSIRLNVFELEAGDMDSAKARVNDIVAKLQRDAWEPAVSVRSSDANIHMYMKMDGDRVAGMTVMMVDPDGEAVFMNIVGEIDPQQLGRVAAKFGVSID